MKSSFKIIALFLATTFPCVAFAEILGAPVPALTLENGAILFALLLIGLTFVADYARPNRKLRVSRAVALQECKCESHRLAA